MPSSTAGTREMKNHARDSIFPRLAALLLLLWGATPIAGAAAAKERSDPVVVQSPDGRIQIELFTRAASGAPSQLQYRVSLSDKPSSMRRIWAFA